MRRLPSVLFFLICGASAARGQGSADFPQTQVYPKRRSGAGGSDASPVRPQRPPAGGDRDGGANQDGGGQDRPRNQAKKSAEKPDAPDDGGPAAAPESREEPAFVDLDGARANFAAVVEGYLAKNSPNGYWEYAERKNGKKAAKTRRLKLLSVDERSIKAKDVQRFSGLVKLGDARGGHPLTLEFIVDFSGADWTVVSAGPAKGARQ